MKIGLTEAADKYGLAIFGRLAVEHAKDWSDEELERGLSNCVCGPQMIKIAKAMRDHGHPLTLIHPYGPL